MTLLASPVTDTPTRPPGGTCPGPAEASGPHRWRAIATWRDVVPEGVDCERPVLVICRGCAHRALFTCKTRHEARCAPCGRRKRRRVVRLAEFGLTRPRPEWGGGHTVGMLTLTGPGEPGHRRWDVRGPRHNRPVCHCRGNDASTHGAARWNPGLGSRWNHLRTVLKRECDGQLEFFRVAEVQKRGYFHLHVLVVTPHRVSVAVVQALALAAGFGCNVDWRPIDNPAEMARYVAKYVTKDAEPGQVPWEVETVDEDTGEIVWQADEASFRAWTQSHGFSMTMGEVTRMALAASARISAQQDEQDEQQLRDLSEELRAQERDSQRWPVDGGALPPSSG